MPSIFQNFENSKNENFYKFQNFKNKISPKFEILSNLTKSPCIKSAKVIVYDLKFKIYAFSFVLKFENQMNET